MTTGPDRTALPGPAAHGRRVAGFGLVSGLGWLVDFAIFAGLSVLGARPFAANLAGASCAVTLVFFLSTRRVFAYRGRFLLGLFALYVLYQVTAITAASAVIDLLATSLAIHGLLAKILVTPFIFPMNYLVMHLLVGRSGPTGAPA